MTRIGVLMYVDTRKLICFRIFNLGFGGPKVYTCPVCDIGSTVEHKNVYTDYRGTRP